MPAHRKNYDQAVVMYTNGLSIEDVASFHGVTRQAMHSILKRRDVEFRPQKKYGSDNHFYRGGVIEKGNANDVFEVALNKGLIKKKYACEVCGDADQFSDGRSAVQGHHQDYNKPLEVIWLCQKCHHEEHKLNKPVGINE